MIWTDHQFRVYIFYLFEHVSFVLINGENKFEVFLFMNNNKLTTSTDKKNIYLWLSLSLYFWLKKLIIFLLLNKKDKKYFWFQNRGSFLYDNEIKKKK